MACEIGQNVIACGPDRRIPAHRHVAWCGVCEKNRRLVTRFDGIYYGTTTYCLACNGCEQEGEWRPRRAGDRYADQNRVYIANLWTTGTDGRSFRRIVAKHERDYWATE
jgi:hypothetical protein